MNTPDPSAIRLDEAGIAWTTCPRCGQGVVPSHNGWRRHLAFCTAPPRVVVVRNDVRSVCPSCGYREETTEHQIICVEGRTSFVLKDVGP
jgi:predicted RNA-binding Zn-ribbon protein involved in translation (DUF1610 family)